MPLYRHVIIISIALLGVGGRSPALYAQDVESFWSGISARLAERDILRASGSLNLRLGLNAFASDDGARRRNAPFTWGAVGGVNLDLLGIQAPFSVAVSSRNTRYNLPSYAFVGLSPSYRWITLHGGDRTLTFSPYSLSGVNFRGGGFELSPGKWYVAGMYGRLRSDRVEDAGAIQSGLSIDAYRRFGRGLKVGFAPSRGSAYSVSYFGSADRFGESQLADADTTAVSLGARGILPERNAVLTFGLKQRLSALVSLEGEVARSALTRDDSAPELPGAGVGMSLLGLLTPRTSTQAANAVSGAVNFTPRFAKFQLKYERIDPGYRTHGSLFFQNDLENVTAGVTAPLFRQRLNLSASGGLQRNDLRGDQASALRRVIGSVNAGVAWRDGVTSSVSVSNFSTTNRFRVVDLTGPLVDSVVLAQTQLSVTASHAHALDRERTHNLVAALSYQRADVIRDREIDEAQGTTFLLGSLNYAFQPEGSRHGLTLGVLANGSGTSLANSLLLGPTAGWAYRFGPDDAGTLDARVGYNLTRIRPTALAGPAAGPAAAAASNGRLLTAGLNGGYRVSERQRLTASANFVRAAAAAPRPGFTDLQVQLAYALTL